jgi:cysteine-rich repeat protein
MIKKSKRIAPLMILLIFLGFVISVLLVLVFEEISEISDKTLYGPPSKVREPMDGIWISQDDIDALPTSGAAWNALISGAGASSCGADFGDPNDNCNTDTLAQALVCARLGDQEGSSYCSKALSGLKSVADYSGGGSVGSGGLGRNLGGFITAASIMDLESRDSTLNSKFKTTIRRLMNNVASHTEERPNNHGTQSIQSRIAAAAYLEDEEELARTATVFKGWLGDRDSYSGFKYGSLSWQADSSKPVGINPKGATKSGKNIDGVLPEEMRRCGSFSSWGSGAPCYTNYVFEGSQGHLAAGVLLHRAGYDVWEWEDKALLRSMVWIYNVLGKETTDGGDDGYLIWIVNYYYDAETINEYYGEDEFPSNAGMSSGNHKGKSQGWTAWTMQNAHGGVTGGGTSSVCGTADEVCASGTTQDCTDEEGYDGEETCNSLCSGYDSCVATESCGDGVKNGDEECDDGNDVNTDTCTDECKLPACGDGHVNGDDVCEIGNTQSCTVAGGADGSQFCLPNCLSYSTCVEIDNVKTKLCGDWYLEVGEECDDGNKINGDGCSSECLLESFENITDFNVSVGNMTGNVTMNDTEIVCVITGAEWADSNIVEGGSVSIEIVGTGCDGKKVDITITQGENEYVIESGVFDEGLSSTIWNVPSSSAGKSFTFTASLEDGTSKSSTNTLVVSAKPKDPVIIPVEDDEEVPDTDKEDDTSNIRIYLIIALVIVLMITVVVAIVIIKRMSGKRTPPPSPNTISGGPGNQSVSQPRY